MNLITKQTNACTISLFRAFQYGYIEEIIQIGFNYLLKHGLKTTNVNITNQPNMSYDSYKRTCANLYNISIHNNKDQKFLSLIIPELISETFFILYGSKYIPSLYIIDEPIAIKEFSINLYSLFAPVTIYCKNRRVIILGHNIPLKRFFQLLFDDKQCLEYLEQLGLENIKLENRTDVIDYFANLFNTKQCPDAIISRINSLVFDDWTNGLYHSFYDHYPTIESVIKLAVYMFNNKKDNDFINLKKKRLIFIEMLFKPLFKSISLAVRNLINNKNIDFLNIKSDDIIKKFINPLGMMFQYDIVNGYSSLISHKASFKNPYGKNQLPACVSNMHSTYKNRICPTTVTNTDPGITISLVPNQNIDFKYGRFN